MKEEIIKDYEKRIIDKINHLKNTASLLTRVTDETIDWSHHVSWNVKRGDNPEDCRYTMWHEKLHDKILNLITNLENDE